MDKVTDLQVQIKLYGWKNANKKKTPFFSGNKIYIFALTWKVEHVGGFFVC